MTNVTKTNPQATPNQATSPNNDYFNGVLYARCVINEIKVIEIDEGQDYCAINAAIVTADAEGNKQYETIDLIVRGQDTKSIIWDLRKQWPTDRFSAEGKWWADINIGSIKPKAYSKTETKEPDAVLSGRLIKVRGITIDNEVVYGEMNNDELPAATLVSPCYMNLIDLNNHKIQASLLDGKVAKPKYQYADLVFEDDFEQFIELNEKGLCPRGYKHRDTNAKIFGIIEIQQLTVKPYADKKTKKPKATLQGKLTGIRHLSVKEKQNAAAKNTDKVA